MTLRFGTDGVRGVANLDLTPELVTALGRAAGRVLATDRLVIGRDTRLSSPMIERALTAGLTAEGIDVVLLGMAPTPAVAWASNAENIAGASISASHNPFPDNGIKFFAPGGRKLTDNEEEALEAELDRLVHGTAAAGDVPVGAAVGAPVDRPELVLDWAGSVETSIEGRRLDSLRVVLDCANGANSVLAPYVVRRLGAAVSVIHASPDGTNINERCGSTDPSDLAAAVVAKGADAGIAFDGDADRLIAVDSGGQLVDGDQIIAICALDRHERGVLADSTVVVTLMSNLGFKVAMAEKGVRVVETQVGDRAVLEALEAGGWTLGGEQSGHVIFRELATTGDGLLTAVQLLDVVARTGRPLAELAGVMTRLPQVLRNVTVSARGLDVSALIAAELVAVEAELGERGRVLVRPSGTEPLVRVMVEAPTSEDAERFAARLADAVESAAGS